MTTTTKTCPECGKEIEITLYEINPFNSETHKSWQEPFWSPCCDASIEVEDIEQLLYDAEQAARDWKADYESKLDREDR